MNEKRKTASFFIRVWQEPSEWQPPGEWRVSVRSLNGDSENLFKSAADLWNFLTSEGNSSQTIDVSRLPNVEGDEGNEK
ncbi:MAG: hypothetical protein IPP66_06045 [Anaerolineales bacterium]|nr:hypothetical protein [Anaerolineales bacterium]